MGVNSSQGVFQNYAETISIGFLSTYQESLEQLALPGYMWGSKCSRLEALFRPYHLISNLLDSSVKIEPAVQTKLEEYLLWFNRQIAKFLSPLADEYVGEIQDFDPRLNEAANLAFHFLVTSEAWDALNASNQLLFLRWIESASAKQVKDNNWLLFRGMLSLFLFRQGALDEFQNSKSDFDEGLSWVKPDGWISDGKNGNVDFYTGFVLYPFMQVAAINNIYDEEQVIRVYDGLGKWGKEIELLTSPNGQLPYFGRSLSYRFAFLAPFLLAKKYRNNFCINPAILHLIMKSFDPEKIMRKGLLDLGLYDCNAKIREHYSVRASAYWIGRAFTGLSESSLNVNFGAHASSPVSIEKRPDYDIVRLKSRTILMNMNLKDWKSTYFQSIIDSENAFVRLTSFGNVQRLRFKSFKFVWETLDSRIEPIKIVGLENLELNVEIPRFGLYRFGWHFTESSRLPKFHLKVKRETSHHLFASTFRYAEVYVPCLGKNLRITI